MSVAIGDDPGASRPEKLFEGEYVRGTGSKTWDVAPDGRFLMKRVLRRAQYSIDIVLKLERGAEALHADEVGRRARVPS